MKNISKLFKTAIVCAVFTVAATGLTSCANGTSTTGSDTTSTMSAPAATDTMSSPSSSTTPMDTTRKDSM